MIFLHLTLKDSSENLSFPWQPSRPELVRVQNRGNPHRHDFFLHAVTAKRTDSFDRQLTFCQKRLAARDGKGPVPRSGSRQPN